jgi:hypothetical protein
VIGGPNIMFSLFICGSRTYAKKIEIDIINGIISMVSQSKPNFPHLLGLESLSKVLATLTLMFK